MDRAQQLYVLSNTPGAIYQDLLIIGTRLSEGPGPSAPGHIRAFDVRTRPAAVGVQDHPASGRVRLRHLAGRRLDHIGGANAWSGISVDRRGAWCSCRPARRPSTSGAATATARTCSPTRCWRSTPRRESGSGTTSSCTTTCWDRDLPSAPVLVTVTHDGRRVDAVAQTTKSGHVFLFNRETGMPLFPDRRARRAALGSQGRIGLADAAAAGQAASLRAPGVHRGRRHRHLGGVARCVLAQLAESADAAGSSSRPARRARSSFRASMAAPSGAARRLTPTAACSTSTRTRCPGFSRWSRSTSAKESSDFARGRRTYQTELHRCHGVDRNGDPAKVFPSLVDLPKKMPRAEAEKIIAGGKAVMPAFPALSARERKELLSFLYNDKPVAASDDATSRSRRACHTRTPATTGSSIPKGYPAVKPPWGTMNAIDLNTGKIAWQVPLGEEPALVAARPPPHRHRELRRTDRHRRRAALHRRDEGREVPRARQADRRRCCGKTQLPAGGYATPSTYVVNGKQYVVIAAGGGKMGTKSGDAYVAYALTRRDRTVVGRRPSDVLESSRCLGGLALEGHGHVCSSRPCVADIAHPVGERRALARRRRRSAAPSLGVVSHLDVVAEHIRPTAPTRQLHVRSANLLPLTFLADRPTACRAGAPAPSRRPTAEPGRPPLSVTVGRDSRATPTMQTRGREGRALADLARAGSTSRQGSR